MWACAHGFKLSLAALVLAAAPVLADAPARVVSMNLCTDLMLMDLAPDRAIALSALSRDPTASPIAELARDYPATVGTAEHIFLMAPDLVLAGRFTERATVDMLRRLGVRVEEFAPARSLEDIRADITRMGQLLGRDAAAAQLLAEFDTRLDALAPQGSRPRALAYFANGYALGNGTLVGTVIEAAGLRNIGAERGMDGGERLSLEHVVFEAPDLIVTGTRYPGASRSEQILDHPALRTATGTGPIVVVPDREWNCGTPHILTAIERLSRVAETLP